MAKRDSLCPECGPSDECRHQPQSPPPIMGKGLAVVAGLFLAAHEGIGADSYDGVEPRYRALMEQAANMARLAGVKPIQLEDLPTLAIPSLPEGMVTDDMLSAGQQRLCEIRSITHFDDEAQAEIFLAMYRAMPSAAPLPEGMVMVPREPWQAMLNAAEDYLSDKGKLSGYQLPATFRWCELWEAMISAAPASALRMDKELK